MSSSSPLLAPSRLSRRARVLNALLSAALGFVASYGLLRGLGMGVRDAAWLCAVVSPVFPLALAVETRTPGVER